MNSEMELPLPGCRAAVFLSAPEGVVLPRQTHSANVAVVRGPVDLPDTDAVVTDVKGLPIGIRTADCVPVLIVDPYAPVAAAVHAGWRGAVAGIVARAVAVMTELGAEPSRMRAALGPCICAGCFEVGEEVAMRFSRKVVVRDQRPRPHVDLPAAVRDQLLEAGLAAGAVSMPPACTMETPGLYSARRSGVGTGRLVSVIELL